jgi:hypothetical protein
MTRFATVSHLAEIELDALADAGITPTPAEIVELSALGHLVETPETSGMMARGEPVRVGGAVLWPFTYSGAHWYDSVGDTCQDPHAALAYCFAHGHSDSIHDATDKDVRAWRDKLTCTRGELDVAIMQVVSQDADAELPRRKDEEKSSHHSLVATLIAAAGGTPDMWERQMSISYVRRVMDAIIAHNAERGKSDDGDPRLRAQVALYWAAEKIRRRHQAEADKRATEATGPESGA